MSFDDDFLAAISKEEEQVQQTLNDILSKKRIRRTSTNSQQSSQSSYTHHVEPNQSNSATNTEQNNEMGSPLIAVPSSEFCSLNMRLLERNNEVKLAMETAKKAEAKLNQYRKYAEQTMQKLRTELESISTDHDEQRMHTEPTQSQPTLTNDAMRSLHNENKMLKEQVELLATKLEQTEHDTLKHETKVNDSIMDKQHEIDELRQLIHEQHTKISNQESEINRLHSMLGNLAQMKRRHQRIQHSICSQIGTFKQEFNKCSSEIKTSLQNPDIAQSTNSVVDTTQLSRLMQKWLNRRMRYTVDKYTEEKRQRKQLYNQLQELRGNIRVYCRVRPLLENEAKDGYENVVSYDNQLNEDESEIEKVQIYDQERLMSLAFTFDRVFTCNSTQQQVFDEISPLIESVLSGYNVCIFAYGQTGAGKTFTMSGTDDNPGVNIRTISLLFKHIASSPEIEYETKMSLLEVYNESIVDLLQKQDKQKQKALKPVIDAKTNRVIVPGLLMQTVSGEEEVMNALTLGMENRTTGVTNMNEHSSRSHLILSIYVKSRNRINNTMMESKLHLIDLAGSERNKKSQAKGDTFKEAVAINSSLAALGDVIAAKFNKSKHVPFRRSILTYLLKDSLGKDCKTAMIVQIAPSNRDVSESSCSLKFANRVKQVQLGRAQRNMRRCSV